MPCGPPLVGELSRLVDVVEPSELAPSTQSLLSEPPPSLLSSELSTSLLSKPLLNVLLSELLSSTLLVLSEPRRACYRARCCRVHRPC